MMGLSVSYQRRKAVANAWKRERILVSKGMGTRNWTKEEQREILAKGKVKGYEGHHMKSVDGHNSRAGDYNNIQFLTRKEHLEAHKGDFHNHTNGFFNHETKEMYSFGRYKPGIEAKKLDNALSQKQIDQYNDKLEKFFKSRGTQNIIENDKSLRMYPVRLKLL